jgi:putative membrane protein
VATWSTFLADLNEAFLLTSAGAVVLGWWFVRHGRIPAHRRTMLTASALAVAFFLSYLVKSLWIGDTTFGGPRSLALAYQVFLQAHVLLATLAGVLGVVTLRRALRQDFRRHRRLAPWTASMWFVATGTGLAVFLLLYVLYRPGPTTNVLRAVGL